MTSVCAIDENETHALESNDLDVMKLDETTEMYKDASQDLENQINNAKNGAKISIEPGVYKIHNIKLTKNITLQGKGNPEDVIIDGENKASIFLIRSPSVFANFKNLTFINGRTDDFGGAISMETGHVTVDNCMFINNTALKNTNAGGISNYGTSKDRGYLLVNNSFFMNNHADHDGGAVTTCYADSYIYNTVFIGNSAHRDGGAIRVSLYGFGYVEDCIFMFNHADEWGGAYYSWSGESDIRRCIFLNNTAGTNGGAVMVSGNLNLQESIIMNNDGGETGGSFYIQQPMYNRKTTINVHDNIITNNTSPYGKEIFISWKDSYNLYTQFNNNDWGDEDPNDSAVNDPNNVTQRSKVSKTIKSNLFERLNVDLLDKYRDFIGSYFTNDSLDNLKHQFKKPANNDSSKKIKDTSKSNAIDNIKTDKDNNNTKSNDQSSELSNSVLKSTIVAGNSTTHGEDEKAYELNETGGSVTKMVSDNIEIILVTIAIVLILLLIGYKREKRSK